VFAWNSKKGGWMMILRLEIKERGYSDVRGTELVQNDVGTF
jgi:hypothetical protein